MLQKLRNRRAQSTLEYAILVVIIIAALLTLQTYIKRGIGGRLRQASDDIGDQFSTGGNWSKTVKSHTNTTEKFDKGASSSTASGAQTTNTTENMQLPPLANEYWGNNGNN